MAQNKLPKRDQGPFAIAILIIVFVSALGLRFYQKTQQPVVLQVGPLLDQISCDASGGVWNSCGSACRGSEGAICAAVCVGYCECKDDTACPFGYSCQEKIDGIGICK